MAYLVTGSDPSFTAPLGTKALRTDTGEEFTNMDGATDWKKVDTRQNNLAASTAPGVTNDVDEGYEVGSVWIDTTANKTYICMDNTDGAAVWNGTTNVGGATVGNVWQFDDAITDSDPGSGKFKLNNAIQANATFIYINDASETGVDMSNIISALSTGDLVYFQEDEDATSFHLASVTGTPTDGTGYWKVPITVTDSGVAIGDGDKAGFLFFFASGGSGLNNVVEDLTPALGGPLDTNDQMVMWSLGTTVASASNLAIASDGNIFNVSGTASIDTISSKGPGTPIVLHFMAAATLVHSASLALLGEADIVTAAGDHAIFHEDASNNWQMINFGRIDGRAINNSDQYHSATMPNVGSSQNNYGPTGFAESIVIRINPTTDIQITGFAAPSPASDQFKYLVNISASFKFDITENDVLSSAANRVLINGIKSVERDEALLLWYDQVNSRWRMIGSSIF